MIDWGEPEPDQPIEVLHLEAECIGRRVEIREIEAVLECLRWQLRVVERRITDHNP